RKDYAALIRYAVGAGQNPGVSPGLLPPGYAPLPGALRTEALAAADRLQNPQTAPGGGEASGPPGSGTSGGSGASGGKTPGAGGGGTGGTTVGGTAAVGAAGDAANPGTADKPAVSANPAGPKRQNVAQSGAPTPSTILGIVRWVLIGVLLAGGIAGLSGPLLIRLSVRKSVQAG
ncbi:hypothetical protein ACMZ42_27070, partial [Lysinibacillus sp. NPDC056185]